MIKQLLGLVLAVGLAGVQLGCGTTPKSSLGDGVSSDVATGIVSGAINDTGGSLIGWNVPFREQRSLLQRFLDTVNPIAPAWAADWSCSGASLSPTFAGPGSYSFTPLSCSVTWGANDTASARWSGDFTLLYGSSCDASHPFIDNQAAGCTVTRTTDVGGNTRTITGPDGNAYAVTHDTHGAGSGWDSSVSPAPDDSGVELSCSSGGCATKTLVIGGSHLTGTVTPAGGPTLRFWDHTVTGNLTVTGDGTSRVVDGTVTVQHNLIHVTTVTTFTGVHYDLPGCCFPGSGSVSTSFSNGQDQGKTERLAFGSVCGAATLTRADGTVVPFTLMHCL